MSFRVYTRMFVVSVKQCFCLRCRNKTRNNNDTSSRNKLGPLKDYKVLLPSLYKIGCGLAPADEQLRFSLSAIHQPLCYRPPTLDEELRLPFR